MRAAGLAAEGEETEVEGNTRRKHGLQPCKNDPVEGQGYGAQSV